MNITLCNKELREDIETHQFDDSDKGYGFVIDWLQTKDFDKSVFVCFDTWHDEFRDSHTTIMVSHSCDMITDFFINYFDVHNWKELYFSIFEFDTYKEAFDFCIDLREGI
jgi:hypothetical protein